MGCHLSDLQTEELAWECPGRRRAALRNKGTIQVKLEVADTCHRHSCIPYFVFSSVPGAGGSNRKAALWPRRNDYRKEQLGKTRQSTWTLVSGSPSQ